MIAEPILQYKGRVPKRAGSLAKRNNILQATLDIIYAEGLRGVRHRAVAELAQVPLSATTYYFIDIDELIVDSFVYFMEQNLQHQQTVFSEILESLANNEFDKTYTKTFINQIFVAYIEQQVSDEKARRVEASFIQYSLRVPALASKIEQIRQYFEQQIALILEALQVDDALFKAQLILAFVHFMEEKMMLAGAFKKSEITESVGKLLDQILS